MRAARRRAADPSVLKDSQMSAQTIETPDQELRELRARQDQLMAQMEKISAHETISARQETQYAQLSEEYELLEGRGKALVRREQVAELRAAAKGGAGYRVEGPSGSPGVSLDDSRTSGHPYG